MEEQDVGLPGAFPDDLCGDAGPTARAAPEPLPRFQIETADFHRGKIVLRGKLPVRDGRRLNELLRLLDAAPDMLAVLRQCAIQFRAYEQQHLAKKTQEADEKAHTNHRFAALCEAAVAKAEGRA